jgi:DNA-binding transcriptional ArsR family regulator
MKIEILKILCDETRYKIIEVLLYNNEDLYVGDIAEKVDISHSAASHQLNKLELMGLVSSTKCGQHVCYKLNEGKSIYEKVINVINVLEQ